MISAPVAPSMRNRELDGLRGVLASLVLVHHYVIYSASLRDHVWAAPASHVLNQLGSASVALFFMVSAYLFGGRVVDHDRAFDAAAFLRHRVARIVPVYMVAVAVSVAVTFAIRPAIVSPVGDIVTELGRWASFGFRLPRTMNGVALSEALMSVSWSLYYEWLLYALLIPIAYLCRATRRRWPAYLVLLIATAWDGHFALFVFGLIAAQMPQVRSPRWVAAAAIGVAVLVFTFPDTTSWRQGALLFPLFVVVAHGLPAARVLTGRSLQYLGAISYDIYLLQIPMLFVLGKAGLDGLMRDQSMISIAICLPLFFIATVAVSGIVHVQVEQRVDRWMRGRPGDRSSRPASSALRAPPLIPRRGA